MISMGRNQCTTLLIQKVISLHTRMTCLARRFPCSGLMQKLNINRLCGMVVHVAVDAISGHGGDGTEPVSSISFADFLNNGRYSSRPEAATSSC